MRSHQAEGEIDMIELAPKETGGPGRGGRGKRAVVSGYLICILEVPVPLAIKC